MPTRVRATLGLALAILLSGCVPRADSVERVEKVEIVFESIDTRAARDAPTSPPSASAAWRAVDLPYVEKDRARAGLASGQQQVRLWVRLPTRAVASASDLPLAVHYSAYIGPFAQAAMYVNGERAGSTDPTADNKWNQPLFLTIPARLTAPGQPVQIVLAIDCIFGALGCGSPTVYVGPQPAVQRVYEANRFWRLDGPRIGSIAMLMLGGFALLFWLGRPKEVVYPLFAAASVVWFLRTLHYYLVDYPGADYPDHPAWFWWMTVQSISWLMVIVYIFAFRLHEQRYPRVERGLLVLAASGSIIGMPGLGFDGWLSGYLTHVVQTVIALGVTTFITVSAVRRFTREHMVLALGLWINIALGIHDMLLQGWFIDIEHFFLMPYGAITLFAAFLYAVVRKYAAAIDEVESLNASLEQRLAQRQTELQLSYDKLRSFERHQAEAAERQRLMREMHDGLGSSLMSSLAMVEQGRLDQAGVARMLRECVDDLKLTIDSLEPMGDDLLTLLATLRYRIGSRLEAAGLVLEWKVNDLPPLPWLNPAASLHVLRILQESLTNIIKHAGATRIRVETSATDRDVFVRVIDNGTGFDASAPRSTGGRGLMNLERRAQQIGGRVSIRSDTSGTQVELALPIQGRDLSDPNE
jgi:signal transduction histidine kinase